MDGKTWPRRGLLTSTKDRMLGTTILEIFTKLIRYHKCNLSVLSLIITYNRIVVDVQIQI